MHAQALMHLGRILAAALPNGEQVFDADLAVGRNPPNVRKTACLGNARAKAASVSPVFGETQNAAPRVASAEGFEFLTGPVGTPVIDPQDPFEARLSVHRPGEFGGQRRKIPCFVVNGNNEA